MKIFYRGNDTDINQVRVSRLANINQIVWRWLNNNIQHGQYAYQQHRFGVYKYTKIPSPRKTMLACWLLMRRQKEERIELEKEQFRLHTQLQEFNKRIHELEAENRDFKYAGYSATLKNVHWTCGDGCCSDSWWTATVRDENSRVVAEYGDKYSNKDYILDCIKSNFGTKLSIDEEYVDDE